MEADLIASRDDKDALRRELRARRESIAPAVAVSAADAIAARLIDTLVERSPTLLESVALFASFRAEVSTAPLASALAARGSSLAFPRIIAGELAFRRAAPTELTVGPYGIRQPAADAPEIVRLRTIVVPGLAFDQRGRRLGWGRGYYDRALPRHPRALRVAIAYDCQLVDEVPTSDRDVTVDLIITETQAIVCPGADRDRS